MKDVFILLILFLTSHSSLVAFSVDIHNEQKFKKYKTAIIIPTFYTYRKDNTLYFISCRYGYDHHIFAEVDEIKFLYAIHVGKEMRSWPDKSETGLDKLVNKKIWISSSKDLVWCWPSSGKILSTYSEGAVGRKGIDIAGSLGQSVIAAASGIVVYSENGLSRYGNIIIIRHNDMYSSAYAYNKVLLVKKGQHVKVGERIALLGQTGTHQNILHFEIRRNGNPVNPIHLLPDKKINN